MGIPIIGDLISEVGKTVRQVIPNKEDQRRFELQLREIEDRYSERAHTEAMGQIETNKIEAAHASVFVAGWRPALGWIGSIGAAVAFVIVPLGTMIEAWGASRPIPEYPIENLMAMILYLLGASGIRSFDKLKGTAFSKLGDNPGAAKITAYSGPAAAEGADSEGDAPWNR